MCALPTLPGRRSRLHRRKQRLLQRRRALLEALGAAPREALVGERRLRSALLAEAFGCVVVDAGLAERACAKLALGRLALEARTLNN